MTISRKENVFYLDRIKYQKKYSGVMDFYALKLGSTAKKVLENIWYLMYTISDDHEMSMNKA